MTGEKPLKILHVDDEENQLEFTKLFLEQIDKDVVIDSVTNPDEALELQENKNYDCIVSDYKMVSMNGIELAQKVRLKSDVPFILYTGQGSEEVAELAFTSGVDDYLRKETEPTHYQVLAKRIQHIDALFHVEAACHVADGELVEEPGECEGREAGVLGGGVVQGSLEVTTCGQEGVDVDEVPQLGATEDRVEFVDEDLMARVHVELDAVEVDSDGGFDRGDGIGDEVEHDDLSGVVDGESREGGRALDGLDLETLADETGDDGLGDVVEVATGAPEEIQVPGRAMVKVEADQGGATGEGPSGLDGGEHAQEPELQRGQSGVSQRPVPPTGRGARSRMGGCCRAWARAGASSRGCRPGRQR